MQGYRSFTVELPSFAAMTAAQSRLADHIEQFYGAADKTSEGAMASHAYKASVAELDSVIGRELVRNLSLYVVVCLGLC